jgi:hypothetical protein
LAAVKALVGWFALLFHVLFCLVLVSIGAIAMAFGPQTLHLEMFPWTGATLVRVFLLGGLLGLVSAGLAIAGRLHFLFLLWSLAVAAGLSKGLIFSAYHFPAGAWHGAAYLIAAAWFALLGAWFLMRAKPAPGPRKYRMK